MPPPGTPTPRGSDTTAGDSAVQDSRAIENAATVYGGEAKPSTPADAPADAPGPAPLPLERGVALAHFVVLDHLGSGGMGLVVSAYDPALDRKVAIKLLHQVVRADPAELRRARLLREAQALARLSHPNVITVYEVGTFAGQVFIAMEHIDGGTLRAWLPGHSWDQVVDAFIAAGRGLAAAHRAGLVHRDFKPENVLVGKDGRVVVTDFGLVSGLLPSTSASGDDPPPPAPPSTPVSSDPLTRAGAILGTPAYMAPEQFEPGTVDPRADQFAFCVALYEALHGERPFGGKSFGELRANVVAGRMLPAPKSDAPARIRALVTRGLSPEPAARHLSMDALVAELEAARRPPAPRWRVALAALGIVAITATLAIAAVRRPAAASPCRGAEARLRGVWDADVRAQVQRSFLETARPYAADTFTRAAADLDRYGQGYVAARTDVCEATAVRHEQSEALLDARVQCLDVRAQRLGALTALFARAPDAQVLDRAVAAVAALEDPGSCRTALTSATPPARPEQRAQAAAVRQRLAEAKALELAGKTRAALEIALPAAAEARALDDRLLRSEAVFLVGVLQAEAGDANAAEATLNEGLLAAADAEDDARVAQGLTTLIWVTGVKQARRPEALALRTSAEAAIRRAGSSDLLRAQLLQYVGLVLQVDGRYAEAEEVLARSLALREQTRGPEHLDVARSLNGLAMVLNAEGRYDEARGRLERALAINEKALGPDHPEVASVLTTLGNTANYQEQYEQAERHYRRALAIVERSAGPESGLAGGALNNLGMVLDELHRYDEARGYYERAIQVRERTLGPDSPAVALSLANLGSMLAQSGKPAEGRVLLERALAIREKLGPEHPDVATTLVTLGEILSDDGKAAEALPLLLRALAIREKVLAKDHPLLARALVDLAECELELARPADALPLLERAVTILEAKHDQVRETATAHFALARALARLGQDPARARRLAEAARAVYLTGGEHDRDQLAKVDAFLGGRR